MLIKRFDISQYRNGEFLSTITNVRDYIAQEDMEDLGLVSVKEEIDKAVNDFTRTFKSYERGSKHTKSLYQLDKERGKALVGFIKHANLYANFPEEEKADAGRTLVQLLKKYGKSPQTKPLAEETGIIIALLKEVEVQSVKQKITLIGATAWIEALKSSNNAFAELYKERVSEESSEEVGATKASRAKAYEIFKRVLKTIEALALINGEEKYKALADKINKELERNKQKA